MNRVRSYSFITRILHCRILVIVCCTVLSGGLYAQQRTIGDTAHGDGTIADTNLYEKKLAILFTNDGHSSGDYARMATLIKQERSKLEQQGYPVILVDAGDIAMGSVFQALYTTDAFELKTLDKMGYDARTFGNHDFDFGLHALYQMFASAVQAEHKEQSSQLLERSALLHDLPEHQNSFTKLPVLLCSNLTAANNPAEFKERTGVKDTLVIRCCINNPDGNQQSKEAGATVADQTESIKIGLFGLIGEHAYSCIVCKDTLIMSDRAEAARNSIHALQNAGVDYIVAISHGGTKEDETLAKQFPQINAIISGHDHEVFQTPLMQGKTAIASTGKKNRNLGKMLFNGNSLVQYELLPVTESIEPDSLMQQWVAYNYALVLDKFHATGNINLDDTIAFLKESIDVDLEPDGNMLLGQLIAESYADAAMETFKASAKNGVETGNNLSGEVLNTDDIIAVVPRGIIRKGLESGAVTNHDIFNVLPLGMALDGAPGYPLVMAYLTGEELWDVCELNASVAGMMEDAQLFFSGMSFAYNRYRIPFTRVKEVRVHGKPVVKDRLYPVVTGLYTAQLMGMLESSSFGILSVQPKDANGNPIENLDSIVLKVRKSANVSNGALSSSETDVNEQYLTEWLVFAEYAKKTELKNLDLAPCSVDVSTPLIWIKYFVIIIWLAWLLWTGKRLLYRRP